MLTLDICPHEAATLVTTLVQRCTGLEEMLGSAKELHEEVADANNALQAELDGMSAGAQLDTATQGINDLMPSLVTLDREISIWQQDLGALMQTHADLGTVHIDTVISYLNPFAARVANWRESINTIINTPATQEA